MSRSYSVVTELPGNKAHFEQLRIIHTRYDLAARHCKGKRLLEVACGPGRGLRYLARLAASVVGGDFDDRLVEAARKNLSQQVPILRFDAQRMPFDSGMFDTVVCFEALYYFQEPDRFFSEVHRVLDSGGTLLISSSNRERDDFIPSAHSVRYLSAGELRKGLSDAGFDTQILGGFLANKPGLPGKIVRTLRKALGNSPFMPKSMAGKAILKRLFYGRLRELGPEIATDVPVEPLVEISDEEAPAYQLIYAVARKT